MHEIERKASEIKVKIEVPSEGCGKGGLKMFNSKFPNEAFSAWFLVKNGDFVSYIFS